MPAVALSAEQKERKNARARKSMLLKREGGFEIGEPPLTSTQRKKGVELRKKIENSLLEFNLLFKQSTGLRPFGSVQIDSIAHDQEVIETGGRVCKAEPRGYGKTARSRHAALWGALTGRRRMIPIFKASLDQAKSQIVAAWKMEIRNTPELLWMFPELIWPLVSLKGVAQSATRQMFRGEPTFCQWTSSTIVFPMVKGVEGAGSVLMALPLKSARGANHTLPTNEILRPDLVLFDDVQKDEDADNPVTLNKIEELIDYTAMRLGGHNKTLSAIMCCTVRRENDLAERYLAKSGWRAVRYKMLSEPAKAEESFWMGPYAKALTSWDSSNPNDERRAKQAALALYKKNRKMADEGAVVAWDWAYAWGDKPQTEISAIQHAYNIKIIDGDSVFSTEYQNQPLKNDEGIELLTPQEITQKQGRYTRGVVPEEAVALTFMIDVHPEILDYEVWAFDHEYTKWKVDCGTFPDQRRLSFNHSRPPVPLSSLFPGMDDGPRTYAALRECVEGGQLFDGLAARQWMKPSGTPLPISRGLIDANGRESAEIRAYCTNSPYRSILTPSFGKGIRVTHKPISQWQQWLDGNYGPEWVPTKPKSGETPGVIFDANYYKTLFQRSLLLPDQAKGAVYLFKASAEQHLRSANAYVSERPSKVTDGIRTVIEWSLLPNRENHPLDCAVGCLVAASIAGIRPAQREKRQKKKFKFSERIAQRRALS